jgi:hypothetical protein
LLAERLRSEADIGIGWVGSRRKTAEAGPPAL